MTTGASAPSVGKAVRLSQTTWAGARRVALIVRLAQTLVMTGIGTASPDRPCCAVSAVRT